MLHGSAFVGHGNCLSSSCVYKRDNVEFAKVRMNFIYIC